jgi:hypothetical protein
MSNLNKLEAYGSQYFTGAQASIWIGDIWVDEVFGIQFSASQSILPIYCYASQFYDAIAKGKALVQGIFEINFIDQGYLYAVLNEMQNRQTNVNKDQETKRKIAAQTTGGSIDFVSSTISRTQNDIILDQLQLLRDVSEGTKSDSKSRRQTLGVVLNELSQLSLASLNKLANQLNLPAETSIVRNIIYDPIPFQIRGYFGNPDLFGVDHGTYKEIRDCVLIGNEMIVGSTDDQIKERYSFLSRSHI